MNLEDAIACLKANGYRVTKPRKPVQDRPLLNAIGKPYGANYDPNYKRKSPLTSINRLYAPYNPRWFRFVGEKPYGA